MKKLAFLIPLILITLLNLSAQDIVFTFNAKDASNTIDSIKATNLISGETAKVEGLNTINFSSFTTGTDKVSLYFKAINIFPNPFNNQTELQFYCDQNDEIKVSLINVAGQVLAEENRSITQGIHKFNISTKTEGIYIINVVGNKKRFSTKIISTNNNSNTNDIKYNGFTNKIEAEKSASMQEGELIHFMIYSGENITKIADSPAESKTYTVDFYECKDADGNNYPIVQIGEQWWMAENLAYLPNVSPPSAESNTEPFYYVYDYQGKSDSTAKATVNYSTYGVLYNWPAATSACPPSWHLPTDAEWKQLEMTIGMSQSEIDDIRWRGTNEGTKLKATNGWNNNGNGTDEFGFSGLPGGIRSEDGDFLDIGNFGPWWSITESSTSLAWSRCLSSDDMGVWSFYPNKENGFSVRCVRNENSTTFSITTKEISDTTTNSAQSGGIITDDGGSEIIARGVCWNTTGNPTISDFKTDDGSGIGVFTSNLTELESHTSYYVRAFAINSTDTVYGEEKGFKTKERASIIHGSFTDTRDNKTYKTVKIGTQEWMAENLAYKTSSGSWAYKDDESYVETYGLLYSWEAAEAACPDGWHLPTDVEWTELSDYLIEKGYGFEGSGIDIAKSLAAKTNWEYSGITRTGTPGNDTVSNNSSGFSGLPSGYGEIRSGSFYYIGEQTSWWCATELSASRTWLRNLSYSHDFLNRLYNNHYDEKSYSVRCVRDENSTTLYTTTKEITDTTFTSAQSGGNITDDGGFEIIARGVCWCTTGCPTISDHKTDDGSGIGEFSSNLTGLVSNTYYYVRAFVINSQDTIYGELKVFKTKRSNSINYGSFTDTRDNKTYKTVQIGEQIWMAENLAYKTDSDSWAYNNDENNVETYGLLYTWEAAKAACPLGWHIPTDDEWKQLETAIGMSLSEAHEDEDAQNRYTWDYTKQRGTNEGTKLKATSHWDGNMVSKGTDEYGFSALPSGHYSGGNFYSIGYYCTWWSSSEHFYFNSNWTRSLHDDFTDIIRDHRSKGFGYSVRCIKD